MSTAADTRSVKDRFIAGDAVPYIEIGVTREEFVKKYGEAVAEDYVFTGRNAKYRPPAAQAFSG